MIIKSGYLPTIDAALSPVTNAIGRPMLRDISGSNFHAGGTWNPSERGGRALVSPLSNASAACIVVAKACGLTKIINPPQSFGGHGSPRKRKLPSNIDFHLGRPSCLSSNIFSRTAAVCNVSASTRFCGPQTINPNRCCCSAKGKSFFDSSGEALLSRGPLGLMTKRLRLSLPKFPDAASRPIVSASDCFAMASVLVLTPSASVCAWVTLTSNELITAADSLSFLWPYMYAAISAPTATAKQNNPIFSSSRSFFLFSSARCARMSNTTRKAKNAIAVSSSSLWAWRTESSEFQSGISIAKCILFAWVFIGLFIGRLLRYRRKWRNWEKNLRDHLSTGSDQRNK